jgi:aspartate 1-decarboxylase
VTHTDIHYDGSLGIDAELMRAANIVPYEQVHVYNINNGERFETYAIEETPASGAVILRGAAARKGVMGDLIIITTFAPVDDRKSIHYKPAVILVDEANRKKEES